MIPAMSGPGLAVVIPAAAGSPWLAGAVAAAVAHGADEVFVVSEHHDGRGTAVPVGPLAGFAARANAGLRRAEARGHRRALLLNDDTDLLPGALRALADALGLPSVAVAGAVLLDWDGARIQQSGIRLHRPSGRVRAMGDDPGPAVRPVDAVSGAAMALDLDAWRRAGGFDERFLFYLEDVDLCRRVRDAGLGVVVAGLARVRHRGGGTLGWGSPLAAWHLGRGHALLARSLGGGPLRMGGRLACVGLLGLAWSARRVGPAGPPRFASGWLEGLGA